MIDGDTERISRNTLSRLVAEAEDDAPRWRFPAWIVLVTVSAFGLGFACTFHRQVATVAPLVTVVPVPVPAPPQPAIVVPKDDLVFETVHPVKRRKVKRETIDVGF